MVYISSQTARIKSMKYLFWSSWALLFLVIINEKTGLYELSEYATYLTAAALSLVHLYNLRFCK